MNIVGHRLVVVLVCGSIIGVFTLVFGNHSAKVLSKVVCGLFGSHAVLFAIPPPLF